MCWLKLDSNPRSLNIQACSFNHCTRAPAHCNNHTILNLYEWAGQKFCLFETWRPEWCSNPRSLNIQACSFNHCTRLTVTTIQCLWAIVHICVTPGSSAKTAHPGDRTNDPDIVIPERYLLSQRVASLARFISWSYTQPATLGNLWKIQRGTVFEK